MERADIARAVGEKADALMTAKTDLDHWTQVLKDSRAAAAVALKEQAKAFEALAKARKLLQRAAEGEDVSAPAEPIDAPQEVAVEEPNP